MAFYIAMLFTITGTAYILRNNKNLLYKAAFIELVILIGFRNPTVGNDSSAYLGLFERLKNSSSILGMTKYGIEIGYNTLCELVIKIGGSFQIVIIISAVIAAYFIVDYLKKHSDSAHFSLWLYITFMLFQTNFTRIRQAIAIGFVLKAYDLISENKKTKAIIFFAIAFLFHYTSIAAIVMLFFYNKKFERKHFVLLIGWLVIAVFGGNLVLGAINSLIENTKYAHYADMGGDGELLLLLYILIGLLVFISRYNARYLEDTSELDNLCFFSFFTIIVQSLSLSVLIFNRAGEYFVVPMLLIFPNIFKYFDGISQKLMIVGVWALSLLLYVYMLSRVMIPYSFFWQ